MAAFALAGSSLTVAGPLRTKKSPSGLASKPFHLSSCTNGRLDDIAGTPSILKRRRRQACSCLKGYGLTTGKRFATVPLPKSRQAIIDAGGLIAYTRKRVMETIKAWAAAGDDGRGQVAAGGVRREPRPRVGVTWVAAHRQETP